MVRGDNHHSDYVMVINCDEQNSPHLAVVNQAEPQPQTTVLVVVSSPELVVSSL